MSNPHPLAYIEAVLYAGAATVACIAGYLAGVVAANAVARWWRRRVRGGPVARLMALHDREEAAATRAYQSCYRCQAGDARFACRCGGTDCYAPGCHGGRKRDPLDGIVVNAEFERIAARLHYDSVREMPDGDGDDAA